MHQGGAFSTAYATAITEENVTALVAKAYSEVNSWKKDDLEQREMLTRHEQ